MNKTEIELVTKMIKSALLGEDGVTEETYDSMLNLADLIGDENLTEMLKHVDATDGSFYLPDNY